MRLTVAMAVACVVFGGIAAADNAKAAVRRTTNIPVEGLGPALTTVAKEFDFQVLYRTEVVGTLRTQGAVGEFTPDEALKQLLSGTGLTYQYLDDKTVTIIPVGAPSAAIKSGGGHDVAQSEDAEKQNQSQGGDRKQSFWDHFRLAQANPSSNSGLSPQLAQSQAPTEVKKPQKSSPQTGEIQEIVVTAQKREERLKDVPISMSVLSGGTLDQSSLQNVSEELTRVPGVVVPPNGTGGYGASQIEMRGVGASYSEANGSSPIAYYLDTVPFGFVRSAFIPDAGAFDLQRIEVLRGPQSTLYGANAENGVVRVLSNDPDVNAFDFKARATGSYTDFAGAPNGGGDLAVNVPVIDGTLAVRGVVSFHEWAGWIDRPVATDENNAVLRDYRFKVAYLPTDTLSVVLSMWSNRDDYGAPNNSASNHATVFGSSLDGSSAEPIRNRFDAYGIKVNDRFSAFSVTSQTSYLDYRNYNEADFTPYGGPGSFFYGANIHTINSSYVFSQEFTLTSTDTGPWHWTAGAFYRNERDNNWQLVYGDQAWQQTWTPIFGQGPNCCLVDFKDTSSSYAVFGQVARRFLNDQFEWTLGLRQFHEDVSTRSEDPSFSSYIPESFQATIPRAVLSWFPNKNTTAYATFSEGFRSGMPQYYSVIESAPQFAAVKPDKLYNYEVGVKTDLFDRRLSVDTSVYYINWRDVQQSLSFFLPGCNDACGGYGAQVNGESASGPGIDFALTLRPLEGLSIGGTFSWNDLTMDKDVVEEGLVLFPKGARLNSSTKETWSVFASYGFPLTGGASGELSVSGNYLSNQAVHLLAPNDIIGSPGTPFVSYSDNLLFANASFTVTFVKNWSVKLYGDNLTNEYGTLVPPPPGAPNTVSDLYSRPRPRTVGLEMNYHYR